MSPVSVTENLEVGELPDNRSINLNPVLSVAAVPVIKDPVVSWALETLKKLVLVVLPVKLTWPVPSGAMLMLPLLPLVVMRESAGAEI